MVVVAIVVVVMALVVVVAMVAMVVAMVSDMNRPAPTVGVQGVSQPQAKPLSGNNQVCCFRRRIFPVTVL